MKQPDWPAIEADVTEKIRLLRAAWECTAKTPEVHIAVARDIYMPRLELLAVFCSGVEVSDEETETVN